MDVSYGLGRVTGVLVEVDNSVVAVVDLVVDLVVFSVCRSADVMLLLLDSVLVSISVVSTVSDVESDSLVDISVESVAVCVVV